MRLILSFPRLVIPWYDMNRTVCSSCRTRSPVLHRSTHQKILCSLRQPETDFCLSSFFTANIVLCKTTDLPKSEQDQTPSLCVGAGNEGQAEKLTAIVESYFQALLDLLQLAGRPFDLSLSTQEDQHSRVVWER